MKYAIHIFEKGPNPIKVKGPYDTLNVAQTALDCDRAKGWIPDSFRTEIVEWDTNVSSMRDPNLNCD